MIRSVAIALLLALAIAGCGGGDDSDSADVPGGADPEAAGVIDDWANALREGDIEKAAGYFEVPSVVQNGTPPIPLKSHDDVVQFNESLPCGAELVEAEEQDQFIIATFKLTERPGAGECGAGVGEEAKTAFVIEDGHITEWRRVGGDAVAPPPGSSSI